jgi:hypothetical protein
MFLEFAHLGMMSDFAGNLFHAGHCALQQLGVSHKIISAAAYELNKMSRAIYMNGIAKEASDAGMLMFIDEAAKNERTLSRRYGRLGKGLRCMVQRWFVRGLCYSIVPVIMLDGIIVYDIVDSPVNGDHVYNFIKELVVIILFSLCCLLLTIVWYRCRSQTHIPVLSVLIMDNYHIHHGEWLR